jgi:hypothetical protein
LVIRVGDKGLGRVGSKGLGRVGGKGLRRVGKALVGRFWEGFCEKALGRVW